MGWYHVLTLKTIRKLSEPWQKKKQKLKYIIQNG